MTQPMPAEPHEGLKADANPEFEALERDQGPAVARGGQSGMVPDSPQPGDEQPAVATGGTAGGDPTAGVTATRSDVEDAVSGDTGPEHPGSR